jgi:uncharacterized cupredoxin-like copper-binding protein
MSKIRNGRRLISILLISMMVVGILSACSPKSQADTGTESIAEATVQPTVKATIPAEPMADEMPVLMVTMVDGKLNVPTEVPSGPVAFDNETDLPVEPVRLNDGVTFEQLTTTLAENEEAVLDLVTLLGSTDNAVGQIIYDLQPGQYVVADTSEEGDALAGPITVGEPSGATPPTADVNAELVDFTFGIPSEIKAGPQVWQISNEGDQWHEMLIVKLNEGATLDDVMAMVMSEDEPSGPPPFEEVAMWSPLGPGSTAWVKWDLPAGEYTVLCFLPDLKGDFQPHAAHGMVANLTVTN